MDSPEKFSVARTSKRQARRYFEKENFGRSFAHILLALKLCPHWKEELKVVFTAALCNWGEELESKERYYDLFNCYEQALEIFPENEEVLSNLGAHLFRLGHLNEAAYYFEKALKVNSKFLVAHRNLQAVSNLLVERWHFRMLNDSHRNEAYREAIFKKVKQGFDYVLDIGTGSGLLSYFAVVSGASNVIGCDYSHTMIRTARAIAEANGCKDYVTFIYKHSSDLLIPYDVPRKVSLVVTETMDAGLFGEHLIQTLLHAWEDLLLPPLPPSSLIPPVPCIICRDVEACNNSRRNGIVVPFGATVWLAAIECKDVAQKYRLLNNRTVIKKFKCPFLLTIPLVEPYDTENFKKTVYGYKLLCDPVRCFYVNFNDVNDLQDYMNGKYDERIFSIKCTQNGSLDCFVVWFDLYLDEDIKLSSSPLQCDKNSEACCWDQAIFPCQNEFIVSTDTSIDVKVKTKNGKLAIEICSLTNHISSYSDDEIVNLSQNTIRYLNNSSLMSIIESLSSSLKNEKAVLDLSPFPALCFNLLLTDVLKLDVCVFIAKSDQEKLIIERLAVINGINIDKFYCILEKEFENNDFYIDFKFDIIFTNLIDATGELKESSVVQISQLRKLLKPDGKFIPEELQVWGQLIHSDWLERSAKVINEGLVKEYQVAGYMNAHKVAQQLDVCLASMEYDALSEEFQIMQMTIDDLSGKPCKEYNHNIQITKSGEATAIVYWFQYQITEDCNIFSSRNLDSHINQAAFMLYPARHVDAGNCVKLNVKYADTVFVFSIE
ncbi:protein arginine N-methyltransferase 9-like [Lycorma delicatula]|uniref:protein arginine N-methyltransferase 9-like n=1 Tax=Lycorma delicatula TaxID=130591 RepID=UPI003F516069